MNPISTYKSASLSLTKKSDVYIGITHTKYHNVISIFLKRKAFYYVSEAHIKIYYCNTDKTLTESMTCVRIYNNYSRHITTINSNKHFISH